MHPSTLTRFLAPLKGKVSLMVSHCAQLSHSPTDTPKRALARARASLYCSTPFTPAHFRESPDCPPLCASNEHRYHAPSKLSRFSLQVGGLDWPLTAPVERGPSEGARSGSKKGQPGYPLPPPIPVRRPSEPSEVAAEPSLAGPPIFAFLDSSVRMAKVGATDPPEEP